MAEPVEVHAEPPVQAEPEDIDGQEEARVREQEKRAAQAGGAGVTGGPLILVGEGREPCPVLYPRGKVSSHVRNAARMLAEYLTKISGAEFKSARAPEGEPPARAVLVGDFGLELPEGLTRDAFVIRTAGERLHVTGNSDLATGFAAAAFLEMLGCRWWSHTEEDVPAMPAIGLRQIDRVVNPPFETHTVMSREAQSSQSFFFYKSRCRNTVNFHRGHSLYPLLKPYAEKHTEIYPMNKQGERKGNKLHFCYTAPGIAEALADALEREVRKKKGNIDDYIYFAGMGDWYGGMCECERCRAAYEEEAWVNPDGERKPGYSGTLLRMMNATAEMLEKRHPGIRVGTFAYMSLENPPGKTVPRKNVVIRMPHLRHCIAHSVDGCQKNRSFFLALKRWCELAPGRVHVWDYGVNFGENFLYPFPVISSIGENIRLYARLGVAGVMIQGNYVSPGGDLVALKNYVWSRLMWNPELRTADVVREFCEGYYGPAADDVMEYVTLLEEAVSGNKDVHMDEFVKLGRMKQTYLTDEMRGRLRGILDRALEKAHGSVPHERRVREAMVSLEAAELWTRGPLEERGGRLVRADLGGDTWDRALALIEHCRKASPREWGSGRSYRMSFLKMHGGPVHTLSCGDLTVKVAPVQDGRIRSISYGGRELLSLYDTPAKLRKKKSPVPHVTPGMREKFSVGFHYFLTKGEPSGRRADMEAEAGVGHWSGGTKQVLGKSVEFTGEGVIRIVTSARQVNRDKKYSRTRAMPRTDYLVGTDPGGFTVEAKRAGAWSRIDVSPPEGATDMAGVTALRLTQPAKGCVVEESYDPPVERGQVGFHRDKGVLVVRMILPEVKISEGGEAVNCVREVRVTGRER